ncbi:MAG: PRC-barrel domain-containing protein [Deltaproteobacteria bacterium]
MSRSIRSMVGFRIRARDGEVGRAEDFFFDDETWTVRYLVDRTGSLLNGKEVLISPSCFDGPVDYECGVFPLSMTKAKAASCPDVDTHKPVSRRKELELLSYYGSPIYWQYYSSQTVPPIPVTPPIPEEAFEELSRKGAKALAQEDEAKEDVHLRSLSEVLGYIIQAKDVAVGRLKDMLVDESWGLRAIVADNNSWLPGGTVLVEREMIDHVEWAQNRIFVDLSRDQVRRLPAYRPDARSC